MELAERVAVVTGGGSGIGRGLALRFAAEGARGVVIADLNEDGAREVAEEIGDAAIAVRCDVSKDEEVRSLIERAEESFGPVDLFAANAGIALGTGVDTPDDVWDLVIDVNVRSHIIAARQLVPNWLERGEGYFLSTASAAGLVTQIGSAPYAVTKHAAVAFSEWLSVTYGDRGIGVSCLCPMGVDTPLLRAGLGMSEDESLGPRVVSAAGAILSPEEVAEHVVEAVREGRFLILPHPEVLTFFQRKAGDYDRWLAGMRRLQAQVDGTA